MRRKRAAFPHKFVIVNTPPELKLLNEMLNDCNEVDPRRPWRRTLSRVSRFLRDREIGNVPNNIESCHTYVNLYIRKSKRYPECLRKMALYSVWNSIDRKIRDHRRDCLNELNLVATVKDICFDIDGKLWFRITDEVKYDNREWAGFFPQTSLVYTEDD